MKRTNFILSRISLVLLVLATTQFAVATANESKTHGGDDVDLGTIPSSARFNLDGIKGGSYDLVGRLSMRRKFNGTRATPPYDDVVQFHCFNGDELKFSTFRSSELQNRLLRGLADGRSLPAMLNVRFEQIQVGYDGTNYSDRVVAQIQTYQQTTAEAICAAAAAAGFDAAGSERYQAALEPDFQNEGVAVSLGGISVRSNVTPRGSAVSIHGIRTFNSTSKVVTVEIIGLSIEQEGVKQQCVLNKRTRAPQRWDVDARDWSDGLYEEGKMPGILWMFDRSGSIDPGKKVNVQVELKVNGGDSISLTRMVDPI